MKKLVLTAVLCCLTFYSYSQDKEQTARVEKSVYGIQTGFFGVWVHGEFRLSNKFALRAEIGLDLGTWENQYTNDSGVFLSPVFILEPRFYYNLNKRLNKGKRIDGNSGNFIALKTSYHPDLFTTGLSDPIEFIADIAFVPTWGIRRNIGKHFNYETGIGVGYVIYFDDDYIQIDNTNDLYINIHARIGYKF